MVFSNSSLLQGFLCLQMCWFFFWLKHPSVRKGTKQETKNLLSQIFFLRVHFSRMTRYKRYISNALPVPLGCQIHIFQFSSSFEKAAELPSQTFICSGGRKELLSFESLPTFSSAFSVKFLKDRILSELHDNYPIRGS